MPMTEGGAPARTPVVAIHERPGSFSDGWIRYCVEKGIPYRSVDGFSQSIWKDLDGCQLFLWHWPHWDASSKNFAQSIINAIEAAGVTVFPAYETAWHFDDKVAQKYLLEAIGAPVIPSHCFFSRAAAETWLERAKLPLVFKLRCGAGASNVKLVTSKKMARALIKKSFGRGFPAVSKDYHFREAVRLLRKEISVKHLRKLAAGLVNIAFPSFISGDFSKERGYAYFQEFAENNSYDIRVIVIGRRAIAIKRLVRPGDFRASGSGLIAYDPEEIPIKCVDIAFGVADRLNAQCVAFDFVKHAQEWGIVEISYAFNESIYVRCPGYWLRDLSWTEARVSPSEWIIEDAIQQWRMSSPRSDVHTSRVST